MALGLKTDLYQLTMAAGYFRAGKAAQRTTFELFVRSLPQNRNFILAAGLAQVVEYLLHLRYTKEEIDYLRSLPQFAKAGDDFFDMLAEFRFTGDLFAVPEGTPMFAGEPLLTLRAPLMEAQIPETYLLSTIGYQTLIATKAARAVRAAQGRSVVDFGSRRGHGPEAGVYAARAAYIGGCTGTSNVEAGLRYGVPVVGTAAHSWVMSFEHEREAFERLQYLLGERTIYLLDTYDTVEAAKIAVSLGRPMLGVRLDSGNLFELAPAVRKILDEGGFTDAKIMATGDLNEHKIHELVAARVPIDMFAVGTELVTSADAPALGVVYKMVEIDRDGEARYTLKLSAGKHTLPGPKQIFRFADHDVLARSSECFSCDKPDSVEALQRPVILGGQLLEPLPTAAQARVNAAARLAKLPAPCHSLFTVEGAWKVDLSPELVRLTEDVRKEIAG
ncbi:MAG: nicotinate phosphoribosyltransferase [Bryobacteraceae bacterium]